MKHLVEADYVNERLSLAGNGEFALVDCRFALNDLEAGRRAYETDHLPQAVFIDLDRDLSGDAGEHGGRHPLPAFRQLAATLGRLGIDNNTEVIAYDDQGGMFAARLWWLLQSAGHDRVAVLNGGYSHWKKLGYETTSRSAPPAPRIYEPIFLSAQGAVTAEDVKSKLGQPELQLIDSREERRFLGLEEPIDQVSGHIPGARSFFWKEVLTSDGLWKSPDRLRERFGSLDAGQETIVYCGSGVSACPNILALKLAGFPNVKLYVGSWSDWISYPDNPIAQGKA